MSKIFRILPHFLLTALVLTATGVKAADAGRMTKLHPFSEENSPSICPNGYLLKGIECRGRYCDDKILTCQQISQNRQTSSYNWSDWFSEENPSGFVHHNTFVSGLACSGKYCDNLRVLFTSIRGNTTPSCNLVNRISEERPYNIATCPDNQFVCGLRCEGRYCDNVFLYCSSLP